MENYISKPKRIYFIGIGGISMSALSKFAIANGAVVGGSDIAKNSQTDELERLGVSINYCQKACNITSDIDLIVYSGAIGENNAERMEAKRLNIESVERSVFLGRLAQEYSSVVSVAGTHGKTTTTSMLGEIFIDAKANPSIHLGGDSARFGNAHVGGKDLFITEACEYRNSFSTLSSTYGIITNIEADHLDYYKSLANLHEAFVGFANNCKNVVLWNNRNLKSEITSNVIIVGTNKNDDFFVCNIKRDEYARYSYIIKHKGRELCKIKLNAQGVHNVKDSACAFAVAYLMGVDVRTISASIWGYCGVKRRNERLCEVNNIPIIADYAHHPTEIRNTIHSLKVRYKRIMCIFQPHTYSRTKTLMEQFVNCFEGVDKLVLYKTYPAREVFDLSGDCTTLYEKVSHPNKKYVDNEQDLFSTINLACACDVVLVLGAGDIYDIIKNKYCT